ncbi:MAG: DUF1598 domain-containing protein [Aureliella sp.]
MRRRIGQLTCLAMAVLVLALPSQTFANNNGAGGNNNGGNNNGGNNNGGNNNNNNNNNGGNQAAGVRIDAAGVLRVTQSNPMVTMARLRAAKQALPQRLAKPSKMRKISLNRLEAAVAESVASGKPLGPEMIALAGLTKLEYVFYYPESQDIVLAGPAEGFGQDSVGRIVGVETGKPTLLLEDLVVALRGFAPQDKPTPIIGVSIDPTKDGLARMQQTLQRLGSNFRGAGDVPVIVNSLRQSLGLNEVTITGIPANTHFAHVLTEADYRMKLIGIGLERSPVPMRSYVDRLTSSMTSNNALLRWYFVPDYQAIATSDDGLAMQMVGQGVKLIGEDELVSRDGSRKVSGRAANPASRGFTTEFTKKFKMIAERNPAFGQLKNLIDLSIAAAFIQDRDLYGKSGWDLGVFGREDDLSVQNLPAPQQVETAINAVMKGSRLITPIGGGITIQARNALAEENVAGDERGTIAKQQENISVPKLADNQWWWD